MGAIVVKDNCIISPDWEGVIEGGFQQSSSWARLFEIARKLEVRNLKIEIHTGACRAFIMGAIVVKANCIISPDWKGVIEGGFQQSSSWVSFFEIARKLEVRKMKIEIHTGACRAFIMEAIVVKENCIIIPDWKGVIKGGFQQSSSWVRLFEIARKLEVQNLKI